MLEYLDKETWAQLPKEAQGQLNTTASSQNQQNVQENISDGPMYAIHCELTNGYDGLQACFAL
jgi:hypothetical protein